MDRETKKNPYGKPPLDESVEDFLLSAEGKKKVRRAEWTAGGAVLALVVLYYAFTSAVYLYGYRTTYGYRHALSLLFSPGRKLFREAEAAEKQNNLKDAVLLLNGALRQDRELFAGHVKSGDIFLKLSKRKEALSSFRKAYAIDSENYYVCRRIGEIYIRIGKNESALPYLQKASVLAAWDKEAHILLGEAYEGLGEGVEALQSYERSLTKLPVKGKRADEIKKRIKRLESKVYKNE